MKKPQEIIKVVTRPKISEQVLTQMAESNLKIIAIAQKAQESKTKVRTKSILKEIEKSHTQLQDKIRKIAKDNLIIIPNTLYDTSVIKNFIDEINTILYLKKLEISLDSELALLTEINAANQNNDLKALIKEVIPVIKKNMATIKKEQKQLQ